MEGFHDDGRPAAAARLEQPEPARPAVGVPAGRQDPDELAERLRTALQAAVAQLADATRALRERDERNEQLLASAAAELNAAAQLLRAQADERGRDDAARRLRRLAEDLERMARPPATPSFPSPAEPRRRPRLLVADDEPDARDLLAEALGAEYEVLTASDGQEAVDLARAQHPDAVLLDLNMPRLDGFQVLEQLRADPATVEIPVILVSARGDDAGKVRALDQGAVDYLQKPFSEREMRARVDRTIRLFRRQTALRQMAQTDPLTGLANLRAFQARLEEEVKRARRYRTSLTCVMADLDELKPINDELGHAAGDRAIAAVAAIIRDELRETDFGARYGGDEFVLLLPHTAAEEGRVLAERICARVLHAELVISDRRLVLGSSFGVACRTPEADGPAEELVHAADAALYSAKRAGRGRVVLAGGALPAPGAPAEPAQAAAPRPPAGKAP
ncbi:MAG TPA: diguanylate cyclase [Anaeromyxobacter sp.]|nr:diguanylate cyclase [Anaeromyxobacter sp.]